MPKVAHFIDSHDPGGAETVIIEICRNVEAYGYTPVVYHFGNPWLEEQCRKHRIPESLVPGHRWYKSSRTLPLFIPLFIRFLRQQKVDILHSHLFGPVTGASFATFLAGIPHIGTFHDIYTVEDKKERIRYIRLSKLLGTRLVTVSQQMKEYLAGLGGFDNGALTAIVNGVDLERFSLQGGDAPAVRRARYPDLGLCPDDVVLISVGRLEEIKGYDVLLEAFGRLDRQDPVKLLIIGEGPCRPDMERQIDELNLRSSVMMLGQRNDVPALLNLCDFFVLASRSEGLSCSIIEAMAAGLPIVATNVGGNSELVLHGLNGYLAPAEDPEVLSIRMQSVIDDAARRRKFGEMSLQVARKQYSLDAMIRKYVNTYDAIIEKSRGHS